MQNDSHSENKQRKNSDLQHYLKRSFDFLAFPIIWLYHLQPIEKFTALLCVVGGIQTWAFVQSERAFVSIAGVEISGGALQANIPLSFLINVKNSGRDTAFIGDSRNVVRTQPDEHLGGGLRAFLQKTIVVGPVMGGESGIIISRPVNSDGNPIILGQESIDQLNSSKHYLWLIGYISYRDDFSRFGTRTIGYCFKYNPAPPDKRLSFFERCGSEEYEYYNP
jgi:hypothetical protein